MKVLKIKFLAQICAGILSSVLVIGLSLPAHADPVTFFDIPSQGLDGALVRFAEQADVNVVVSSKLLTGHMSSPIVGPYALAQGLSALLSKSPFVFRIVDNGRSVVVEARAKQNGVETPRSTASEGTSRMESMLVVSARHRDETLHEVPMSVAVFGGERLGQQGTRNLAQLSHYAGNTVFKVTRGTNSAISAYIRGLGQDDPIAGYQTGIGVYVDGVYINRPQTPVMDIYDAERIEILRGPQGALYGRNTIGGALKYITKPLSSEPGASVSLALGSYGQQDIILRGESPIEPGYVKVGATFASFKRDGFGVNVNTGEGNYDKDILGFRSKMEISPNESLSLILSYDLSEDNSNVKSGYRRIGTAEAPLLSNVFDTEAGITQSRHPLNDNSVRAHGLSATLKWDLSNHWRLTSITASRKDHVKSAIDFISQPSKYFDTHVLYDNAQRSQELRAVFADDNVDVLIGGYYLDANALSAFETESEPFPTFTASQFSLADVRTKSESVFASVTLGHKTEWRTALGARYTEDRYTAQIYRDIFAAPPGDGSIAPFFGGNGVGTAPVVIDDSGNEVTPRFEGQRTDYAFTPQVSVSWHPSSSAHIYASYSLGYKSGSFDPRGDYAEPVVRDGFDPEYVDAYEIGLKALFWGEQIRTNLALFHNTYSDVQISVGGRSGPGGVSAVLINGADAIINGGEFDAELEVLDSRLNFLVAMGYLSARFTRYIDENGLNQAATHIFPNAPKLTASLGTQYSIPLEYSGSLSLSLSVSYVSDIRIIEVPSMLDQSAYTVWNAGVTWQSPREAWELGFHGLNLLDKRYVIDGYDFTGYGFVTAFYGDPRTLTASLKYTF